VRATSAIEARSTSASTIRAKSPRPGGRPATPGKSARIVKPSRDRPRLRRSARWNPRTGGPRVKKD
jgi:hypothetical protein